MPFDEESRRREMRQAIVKKLDELANLFNHHWVWKVIISFLPSIWFPIIIKYLGTSLKLVKSAEALTTFGWVATLSIYFLALCVLVISSRNSKTEDELKEQLKCQKDTSEFYDKVVACVHSSNEGKTTMLLQSVGEYMMSGVMPYTTMVDPVNQLKNLSTELRSCFHELTGIPKDRIIVSMAYQLENGPWDWVDRHAVYGGLTLDVLTSDPRTAFYQLITSNESQKYICDKVAAIQDGEYIADTRDNSHKNVGSLLCWKIDAILSDNVKLGRIVVSISSYGTKFSKSQDNEQDVKNSIDVIYRIFEELVLTELICLYLTNEAEKRKKGAAAEGHGTDT